MRQVSIACFPYKLMIFIVESYVINFLLIRLQKPHRIGGDQKVWFKRTEKQATQQYKITKMNDEYDGIEPSRLSNQLLCNRNLAVLGIEPRLKRVSMRIPEGKPQRHVLPLLGDC